MHAGPVERQHDAMRGTVYFLIGAVATGGFQSSPNERSWLLLIAIVFLLPGVALLHRVGRQL